MRLTKEKLLEKFPTWNESRHDIVKTWYADEPLVAYNEEEYQKYGELSDRHLINIGTVDAYIYSQNGEYNKYVHLIGSTYIKPNGNVLCGDINIEYGGDIWHINLNKMYNKNSLSILRFSAIVTGFSNKDGTGSPCIKSHTKEAKPEVIEKVINKSLDDFGYGVQQFMEAVRELYYSDTTNYIMDKCWGST